MKKRLLSLIMAIFMVVSFFGCDNSSTAGEVKNQNEAIPEDVEGEIEKEDAADEEWTEEYPVIDVDNLSAEECNISGASNSDIIIDCASWYEDKSADVRWYRDNGFHWSNIRKVNDFDDYGDLFTKEEDKYVWTEDVLYCDAVGDGWEFSGNSEPGETKINIGKLEKGKYILIVCNDFGTQFGAIMQKYNITVE